MSSLFLQVAASVANNRTSNFSSLFSFASFLVVNLIQVVSANVTVQDSNGKEIDSQILPIVDASKALRKFYAIANLGKSPPEGPLYWLAFTAVVPPLGFSTYIVTSSKKAG